MTTGPMPSQGWMTPMTPKKTGIQTHGRGHAAVVMQKPNLVMRDLIGNKATREIEDNRTSSSL